MRGGEKAEIRRKLWLCKKAILVWARLMKVVLMVGEIVGTVRSDGVRPGRFSVTLCFDLGFPT